MILSDTTTHGVSWSVERRYSESWTLCHFVGPTGKDQSEFSDEDVAKCKMKESMSYDIPDRIYRVIKRTTTTRIIEEAV